MRLDWVLWVFGVLVGLVLLVWTQWFFGLSFGGFWPGEQLQAVVGDAVGLVTFEIVEAQRASEVDAEVYQASKGEDKAGTDSGDSDQFSEAEWLEAQCKLQDQERRTGLTFVQRARLRRQIAAGGIVEPPVMLERLGSLPDWLTSPEQQPPSSSTYQVGGSSSSGDVAGEAPAPAGWSLSVEILVLCSRLLVVFLGGQAREWHSLRNVSRAYRRNAVLGVICRLQHTGAEQIPVTGASYHATYRWDQVEGRFQWVPVSFEVGDGPVQGSESGFSGVPEPSAEAAETVVTPFDYEDLFEHDESVVFPYVGEFVTRHFLVVLLSIEGGRILDCVGYEGADIANWLICSDFFPVAIVCAAAEQRRLLPGGIIYEGYGGLMLVQEAILGGAVGSSSSQHFSPSPDVQIGGSSSSQHFSPSPDVQIGGSSSSQHFSPSPDVQIGGNSSSQHFSPSPDVQIGGSSSSQQVPPSPDAQIDLEEDPTLDDRPHRALGTQIHVVVQLFREEVWSSSESESGDSTAEPSIVSASSSDAGGSEEAWVIRDAEARIIQDTEPQALGVNFRAGNEVLIGTFADDEFSIHLEGWSQAEVETLVTGLNGGEWMSFHTMLAQTSDQGSEASTQVSSSQGAAWVIGVVVGLGLAGAFIQSWSVGFVLGWFLLFWYRSRRGLVETFARVWGVRPRGDSCWVVFLYVLWLVLGGVLPSSAEVVAYEDGPVYELTGRSTGAGGMCPEDEHGFSSDADRSLDLWLFVACVIGIWEIVRALLLRMCRSRKRVRDQAVSPETVPWPLHPGVPHRANILYCYWRAGYAVDVSEYPEGVQSRFYDLLGSHLVRRDRDNLSSTDSSD